MRLADPPSTLSILDDLAERYPTPDEVVSVVTEKKDQFKFRQIRSLQEIRRIQEGAAAFAESGMRGAIPGTSHLDLPQDEATFRKAYCLGELCIGFRRFDSDEDGAPLVAKQWLELSVRSPLLFATVYEAVDNSLSVMSAAMSQKGVEAAKKNSKTTPDSPSSCELAGQSGEDTPTS